MILLNRWFRAWLKIKDVAAVLLCLCMIVGLMWSRALLSISIVVFFANSLHPDTFKKQWNHWKKDFFSIACFLFFLTYVLSGIWSKDTHQWWDSVTNKMPFAVLPFAFLALPLQKIKWQKVIIAFLLLVHTIVIIHSLGIFFSHLDYYIQSYKLSVSIPTTKYDDHIRFSLSLVACLIIIVYYLFFNKKIFTKKWERTLLFTVGILFILYIHVLAAKTGLIVLYISFAGFIWYLYFEKSIQRKHLGLIILLTLLLPVVLYFSIPTFKEKIKYVQKEWKFTAAKDSVTYQLSEGGRIISYQVATKVWQKNKWLGTGAGDIINDMDSAYAQNFPEIPPGHRLIPHSQYFFCLTGLGLIFGLSILILALASFWHFPSPMFFGRITSIILLASMIAEAMLEIQFGVFIFLFYLLFWKNLPPKNSYHQT